MDSIGITTTKLHHFFPLAIISESPHFLSFKQPIKNTPKTNNKMTQITSTVSFCSSQATTRPMEEESLISLMAASSSLHSISGVNPNDMTLSSSDYLVKILDAALDEVLRDDDSILSPMLNDLFDSAFTFGDASQINKQ